MATSIPNRVAGQVAVNGLDPSLLSGIRRRKLADAAFSLLGLMLVAGSLAVLVMLFGQLVRDGSQRLFAGHLVKDDGFAPSIREQVGVLRREGEGEAAQWMLDRQPYTIVNAAKIQSSEQLAALAVKPVVVTGDLPAPGQTNLEATTIKPAESPLPTWFSRDSVQGILHEGSGVWTIEPAPLALDLSDIEARIEQQRLEREQGTTPPSDPAPVELDPATLDGRQVAVAVVLSKELPLKVKSVEPLEFQGFFNSMPSREADRAGVKSALVGSILVVSVTMFLAIPFGVAAGVWLEEYSRKNWFTALIEINIANLAGVPSIVWGLMALGLLVYQFDFGRSIQTAGITLGLLVLPIVIMATREAIRTIPVHIREASYACGASKWQTVRYHVLPYSMSGILTGSIIGLSRAIGETAPLITIGALTYIAFLPEFSWSNPFGWLRSGFTVLPIQMFNWISRPDVAFQQNAAAAGIILLGLTLSMNAVAIVLRYRLRKGIKW